MTNVYSLKEIEESGYIQLGRGKVISKRELNYSKGNYPVYSSSKIAEGKFGNYGKFMFNEELITWSVDGGGNLFYRHKHKFSITNVSGFIRILKKDKIDYKYLYYCLSNLHSKINFDWVKKAHPSVLRKEYNNIPLPSLEKQQKIAAKLDVAFSEIDKTIEASKRIDENAQALFETARNDVFISKDVMWKQNKLGNICNFLNGFAFKSTDAVDISNVQLLRMGNMYRNKLDLNRKPVFYPSQFSVDFSKYVILPGDIIMSLTGTVGKRDYGYAVRIGKMEKILLLNQRIVKLYEIDESQVNKDYFLFYLRSKDFLNVLYSTANGTRQANLSSETIKGLSIPICSINEQKKIVAKLSFLKKKTKYISDIQAKKIYNLKSLKSSMLINMFTIEKTNAA